MSAQEPFPADGYQNLLIHLRGIVLRASDVEIALARVDYDPFGASHAAAVVFERTLVLQGHDALHAFLFHGLRHVVAELLGRIGPLLLGVGEDPEPLETHLAHELQKLFEIGLRFARVTYEQRRAQREVRNGRAQTADQLHRLGLGVTAVHGRELGVGNVLERNVEVFADFRFRGHHFDHLVGESGGVGVVEAYPRDAVDEAQAAQQLGQHPPSVEVDAVIGRVLRDDHQFPNSLCGEFAGLLLQLLHRDGDVAAADERNGAVAAFPVAALRDFQIGVVLRGGQAAFGGQRRVLRGPQCADDAVPCAGAEVFVHLGNLGPQFVGVAFREASHDEQPFDLPGLLGRRRAQNHVDRLLLGVADESAGVDHHHFGIGAVAVEEDFVPGGREPRHQVLRIDGVLRTAERDDVNFFHLRTAR